jgi:hypothetical protein
MTSRARPEQQIQGAVFQHFRARSAPNVFAFHPANGGYRKPIEAKILQGLGVTSGVPDVIAIKDGRRVTDVQRVVHERLREAGAEVAVAYGIDQALAQLEAWNLLRHDVARRPGAHSPATSMSLSHER